jgi:hypothetical protein
MRLDDCTLAVDLAGLETLHAVWVVELKDEAAGVLIHRSNREVLQRDDAKRLCLLDKDT